MIIRVSDTSCPGSRTSLIFLVVIENLSQKSQISQRQNDHQHLWYKLSRKPNVSHIFGTIGSVSDIFGTHWKAVSEISDISDANDHSRLWYKLSRKPNVSDIFGTHWKRLWYFWYSLEASRIFFVLIGGVSDVFCSHRKAVSDISDISDANDHSRLWCKLSRKPIVSDIFGSHWRRLWYFWFSLDASLIFLVLIEKQSQKSQISQIQMIIRVSDTNCPGS